MNAATTARRAEGQKYIFEVIRSGATLGRYRAPNPRNAIAQARARYPHLSFAKGVPVAADCVEVAA